MPGTAALQPAVTMSMASSQVGRDGPYVSIGLKIFTVAVVILALMCAATALTVYMATQVSRELDLLGHGYMEAMPRWRGPTSTRSSARY